MGNKLPVLSGKEVARVLQRAGFEPARQKGSHLTLVRHAQPRLAVVVPMHREIDRGTLRAIIRQSGLGVDQFLAMLDL